MQAPPPPPKKKTKNKTTTTKNPDIIGKINMYTYS